jgi:oxygen-independent coproporphyrinogen-3 oxidase
MNMHSAGEDGRVLPRPVAPTSTPARRIFEMPGTPTSTLGIYVSIPFCRAKCSYCNFASGVFSESQKTAYVERLCGEIRSARERMDRWGAAPATAINTLYLGGGTPSTFSGHQLEEIIHSLHECFTFAPDTEFTLECAPGQISDSLRDRLPTLGVNRVSLGVQSFVDSEAAAVGRSHTRAVVFREIERLRGIGIDEINVDLIAGLPRQTLESWRTSIDVAIDTGAPHLSVYMLDVDDDSRLGREMQAGGSRYGASQTPDEPTIAAMYEWAMDRFAAAGVPQYEISNFARPGHESRHNLKYWLRQPYLGFGLDAHSCLPVGGGSARRLANTDQLSRYLDGDVPPTLTEISPEAAIEETWFLGMRLNRGVSLSEMEREFSAAELERFHPVWTACEQEGLMERSGDQLRLTRFGRLFANDVFTRFLGVPSLATTAVSVP